MRPKLFDLDQFANLLTILKIKKRKVKTSVFLSRASR